MQTYNKFSYNSEIQLSLTMCLFQINNVFVSIENNSFYYVGCDPENELEFFFSRLA